MAKEKTRTQDVPEIETYYSWTVNDREKFERSRLWYITMSIIGVSLLVYSIFTANFLFAIMIVLVTFIVIIKDYMPVRELSFSIADKGIILDNKFYPYRKFESFYIIYEPPTIKKLYFEFKGVRPDLSVDLKEQDPLEIRDFLLQILPENLEKEDESTMDVLEKFLKL